MLREIVESVYYPLWGPNHGRSDRTGLAPQYNPFKSDIAKDVAQDATRVFKVAFAFLKVVAIVVLGAVDEAHATKRVATAFGATFDGKPPSMDDDGDANDHDDNEGDGSGVTPAKARGKRRGNRTGAAAAVDGTVRLGLPGLGCTVQGWSGRGLKRGRWPGVLAGWMRDHVQFVMTDELRRVITAKKAEAEAAAAEAKLTDAQRAELPAPPSVQLVRTLADALRVLHDVAVQQGRTIDADTAQRQLAAAETTVTASTTAKADAAAALAAFRRDRLAPAQAVATAAAAAGEAPTAEAAAALKELLTEEKRLLNASHEMNAAFKAAVYTRHCCQATVRHIAAYDAAPAAIAAAEAAVQAAATAEAQNGTPAAAAAALAAATSPQARARRVEAERKRERTQRDANLVATIDGRPRPPAPADTRTPLERALDAAEALKLAWLGHGLALALPPGANKAHAAVMPLLYLPVRYACLNQMDAYEEERVGPFLISCARP